MAKKTNHLKELIAAAVASEDQTETKTGGEGFAPAAAGKTYGRLVSYIELGVQKQKDFEGKKKKPIDKVRLTFELLGKKNIKEIETKEGKKITIADRIDITLAKSLHKKAAFKKLFNKMQYGREEITHMAQMLGEAFKITVVHNKSGDKTYANITDEDGVYMVGRPYKESDDEDEAPVKVKVADAISELKLFLWDHPTKETWDALFIDGDREEDDGKGKTKKVSKNWIQALILGAENFEGSPLEQMLEGAGELPDNPEDLEDEDEEVDDDESDEDTDDSSDEEDTDSDDDEETEEESEEDSEETDEDDSEDESDDDEESDDSSDEVDDSDDDDDEEEPAPKPAKKKVTDIKSKSKVKVTPKVEPAKKSVKSAVKPASTTVKPKGTSVAAKTASPSKGKSKPEVKAKKASKPLGKDAMKKLGLA